MAVTAGGGGPGSPSPPCGGGLGASDGRHDSGAGGAPPPSDGSTTYTLAGMIKADGPTTMTVSGKPAPVQLFLQLDDGSKPTKINWSVPDSVVGSVGSDGVFTANGAVGGVVTVTAAV